MIRKILLVLAVAYITLWFAGAYLIKSRLASLIKHQQSDNLRISYDDMKIAGFPNIWAIEISKLKIKLVNHINSKEISIKKVDCLFDLSLKKLTFKLGSKFELEQNSDEEKAEYSIMADKTPQVTMKFNKPLYQVTSDDSFTSVLKTVNFSNDKIDIFKGNQEIGTFSNITANYGKVSTQEGEEAAIKLQALYDGKIEDAKYKTANLDLDLILNFAFKAGDQGVKKFSRGFTVNNFDFGFNEDSKIKLNGKLIFYKEKLPEGEFVLEMNNYQNIINKLMPNYFILPKPILKKMFDRAAAKAAGQDGEEQNIEGVPTNLKLDIVFSDNGIKIGTLDLLEFKSHE